MPAYLTPHVDQPGADLRSRTLCVRERRVEILEHVKATGPFVRQDVSAGDRPRWADRQLSSEMPTSAHTPGSESPTTMLPSRRGQARGPSGPARPRECRTPSGV
jgi:hypothetical protein